MVGITPLISHVPDKAPMISRMRMDGIAAPMVSVILSEICSHDMPLLRDTHIATNADSIRATWLDPARVSSNTITLMIRSPISMISGNAALKKLMSS